MASLLFLCITFVSALRLVSSSSICPPQSHLFLNRIQHQCPVEISPSPAIEVDGDSLERALGSNWRNTYASVLFYSYWCPFSHGVRPTFDTLSSMFPQVRHLAVEQSSAMPSVFSRYGIHSLPSIVMINQTGKVRYHGPKDLTSLVHFYKSITGLEPVEYFTEDQSSTLGSGEKSLLQLWRESSTEVILAREPYLIFSILFLCLRAVLYLFPEMLSRLKAFWFSYIPRLNLEIFGETSQLLEHALHVIDVKRVWSKPKLCKTRNFHQGAKNAHVWASSLASVSLGESSSARGSPAVE
ncbi:PREDICTED: 5'-adenylylsulfate reductase-like 5 [Nelumbo nucifera]|uniref:5'-adenylylsulfate reductase-like 5 n=1 Tax=Nelumbo nucifera TaxID=4432 RepID=A0A1U7ZZ75_NELNU|nr:PREDICTED: 5'-adenylylsulfate reductase-like 5 [Nelumbo nucifera]